jgi:hypothetical protein
MQSTRLTFSNCYFFHAPYTREYLPINKRTILSIVMNPSLITNQQTEFPYMGDYSFRGDSVTGYTKEEVILFWMHDVLSLHSISPLTHIDFGDDKIYVFFIENVTPNPMQIIHYRIYLYNQTRRTTMVEEYYRNLAQKDPIIIHHWYILDHLEYSARKTGNWSKISEENFYGIKARIRKIIEENHL